MYLYVFLSSLKAYASKVELLYLLIGKISTGTHFHHGHLFQWKLYIPRHSFSSWSSFSMKTIYTKALIFITITFFNENCVYQDWTLKNNKVTMFQSKLLDNNLQQKAQSFLFYVINVYLHLNWFFYKSFKHYCLKKSKITSWLKST